MDIKWIIGIAVVAFLGALALMRLRKAGDPEPEGSKKPTASQKLKVGYSITNPPEKK